MQFLNAVLWGEAFKCSLDRIIIKLTERFKGISNKCLNLKCALPKTHIELNDGAVTSCNDYVIN